MENNNQVTLTGCFASDLIFSHEVLGEKFYTAFIAVARGSGTVDMLPALFSERIIDTTGSYINEPISITGSFRSYNQHDENKTHLLLYIFVTDYEWSGGSMGNNAAVLEGYLCKKPIYRKTPLGREIADILLAVNRPYGKSDYIPCICWGRNARFAGKLEVGEHVAIWGRIQSREYMKKLSEEEAEKRIAYEVSVSKLELMEE